MTENQFKDNGKFSYFQLTRSHMYLNTIRAEVDDVFGWMRGLTPDVFERANIDEALDAAKALREAAEALEGELRTLQGQALDVPVMPGVYLGLMEQAARKAATARQEVLDMAQTGPLEVPC